MDITHFTEITILAILAVVCLVAFFIYRGRAKVPTNISLDLDASNNAVEPAGGARIEAARSRLGGATADDSTGKGASIKRTQVKGDLRAIARDPEAPDDSKGGLAPKRALVAQIAGSTARDARAIAAQIYIENYYGDSGSTLPTPRQLRAPPDDFTGRQSELKELREAIEHQGFAIVSLRGLGGVGKTALALKLADLLTPRFPDGQLYLNLQGFGGKAPLDRVKAQALVIAAYCPGEKLPDDDAAVDGLYRSILAGKRTLLLMDNAFDAIQVEPLIPPPPSVLIVTSRTKLTLPGLFAKDLDSLPIYDARKVLLKIAPRIADLADEIARLCGCLPLALRAAAGTIAETLGLEPSEYVKRLEDERTRLVELSSEERPNLNVQASIAVSYDVLDPLSQKTLRELSVFPASFDPAAEEVVCVDTEHRRLEALVRRSLVDFDSASKRYRLHDLVRFFARSKLTVPEAEGAARKHADHFLGMLEESDRLYLKGGNALTGAIRFFDLELANIKASQAWSEGHAGEQHTGWPVGISARRTPPDKLGLWQYPHDEYGWLISVLAPSRLLEDRKDHQGARDAAYYFGTTVLRVIEFHHQNLAIAREMGDRRDEMSALADLGSLYQSLGEPLRANCFFDDSLAIARDIGDRRGERVALTGVGRVYNSTKAYDTGIEFHEQGLSIARETEDPQGEADSLFGLGFGYEGLRDYARAIEFYEKSLATARQIGDRQREADALGSIGIASHATGDYHRAIDCHQQYLSIARDLGNCEGEGTALWNLSLALDKIGERAQAVQQAEAALKIREEMTDPRAVDVRHQLNQWNTPSPTE
jgi:tetratricopeptide (TPR) repeat protein